MTALPSLLESALARVEALEDVSAREAARSAASAILELHREGLRRLFELATSEAGSARLVERATGDELIASLLLLHDLHPLSVRDRVQRALDEVDAGRASASARIELLFVDESVVRVRVAGGEPLRSEVARVIREAAPEAERIEILSTRDAGLVPTERLTRRSKAEREHCELCGQPIASEHEHLFDIDRRKPKCVCTSCALLFEAKSSELRRIRKRMVELPALRMSEQQWSAFEVPVGLAFFTRASEGGIVTAGYPGPAGVIERVVPDSAWQSILAENPALATLEPDIEALLVNRLGSEPMYHVASIDECYRLTGRIRGHWQGPTGGEGALRAVRQFFGEPFAP